jgi:hypothetical protein
MPGYFICQVSYSSSLRAEASMLVFVAAMTLYVRRMDV